MRLHQGQLRRRRSRPYLLPPAVLLQITASEARRFHNTGLMAWPAVQYNRYSCQRLLLYKP